MAIIVEDGTNVDGANSYISIEYLRDYATARGIDTIPVADADVEVLIISAMDYIEVQGGRYQGRKTVSTQPLQFPRYPVYIDSYLIGDDEIPETLKKAQAQLCIEAISANLMPNVSGRLVIEKTIGPMTTKWAESFGPDKGNSFTKVEAFLNPLFARGRMQIANYRG